MVFRTLYTGWQWVLTTISSWIWGKDSTPRAGNSTWRAEEMQTFTHEKKPLRKRRLRPAVPWPRKRRRVPVMHWDDYFENDSNMRFNS